MKVEQAFELVSTNTKHGDDSKCHEADTQSVKSEISTEGNQSIEMDTRKRNVSHLNSAEDGLLNTESSSSNSLSVVVRASISNHSYQETSKDAYSFKNCGSSIDSSNSKAFDFSLEELVTANSEPGVSAQIARKAMRNARTRNRMKVTSMAGNDSGSLLTKKEDVETFSSICSDNSDNFNCTSAAVNNNFCANESSEFSVKKHCTVAMEDHDVFIAEFDLNEEINANDMDDCIKPCHSVIHVVAKAGILSGKPIIPLKFEGGLGWKGSAETSAFRPTASSYRKTRFTGIDLNVAAAVEDVISLPSVFQDFRSQAKSSLWFDLNCLYNAADEFTLPKSEEHSHLIDLDLNVDTSTVEKSDKVHWLGDKRAFDYNKNDYLPDLSTMQHCGPKLPFVSHTSPPFHCSSGDQLSSGVLTYARFSYEQGILPRIFHSGPLHTSFDGSCDVKTEDKLSATIDETGEFSFLAKN